MRKKIVAGNWKMNTLPSQGISLAEEIARHSYSDQTELIVAPPHTHLFSVSKAIANSRVKLSAQNLSNENFGAYTGEISAEMLVELGCSYCIIGHSERRQYHFETDEILLKKTIKAIEVGLTPIFCIGESLEIRENNTYLAYISKQLDQSLLKLSHNQMEKVVIAYEPIWAIGTGKTASPQQAQEIHAYIRQYLSTHFDAQIAENTSILYGGSCNAQNAKELFSQIDIDGGLIGGASLKANDFITIANSF